MAQVSFHQQVRRGLALGIASLLLALTGCAAVMGNLVKAEKTEQRSFNVSPQPSLIVDTFNGTIDVRTIPDNKVEATVTKIGSGANKEAAEADLENVRVNYSQEGETVRIVAKRSGPKAFGSSGASVDLKVPAGTLLTLTTQNGVIDIAGTQRGITARSSNGNIEVHGAKGKLDLETSNGGIDIDAAEAMVAAETSNGNVTFTGALARGSHKLETSNGGIALKLPAAARFQLEARTSNGTVVSRFPGLKVTSGKSGSNHLTGKVGSGSAPDVDLKLETSNGNITVEPAPKAEASAS